ncbi:hypothetical protein GN958_ATG15072, partial [Phytophthora infestans]
RLLPTKGLAGTMISMCKSNFSKMHRKSLCGSRWIRAVTASNKAQCSPLTWRVNGEDTNNYASSRNREPCTGKLQIALQATN